MPTFDINTLTALPGGVIALTFTNSFVPSLTGAAAVAANWTVTGPTQVTVTDVYVSGTSVIVRHTHPLTDGGAYTLGIPAGMVGSGVQAYQGPFTRAFTAAGDTLTILQASPVDARLLRVMFNAPASASALDPANYSMSGGISITSIAKETDCVYLLTTSHQLIGTNYTLTAPFVVAGDPLYVRGAPSPATPSYWGVVTDTGVYNAAFIQALPSSSNMSGFATTIEFNGMDGVKQAFYAFPTSFGSPGLIVDTSTLMAWPFTQVATGVLINGIPYDLYRSTYVPTQSFTTRWF